MEGRAKVYKKFNNDTNIFDNMKREIKFRAWDSFRMHYDFQFIKSGNENNDWILFVSDKQPVSNGLDSWCKNPFFQAQIEIMQFTGLKDKNGKEIYEGDILKFIGGTAGYLSCGIYASDVHPIGTILIVKNLLSGWTLQPLNLIDSKIPNQVGNVNNYIFWNHQRSLIVIGNIYENPELLK
jgi:uncharacterized phage protein (TIGR01671 family)